MKQIFIIAAFALLSSCSKTSDTKLSEAPSPLPQSLPKSSSADTAATTDLDYDSFFKLESYLTNDATNDSTLEIVDDCAIIIYPTHEQVQEMKRSEGEEAFYIGADDALWYHAQVIDTLNHVGIKTIVPSGRFIRLKGREKTWDLDIRKKDFLAWNVIFFKTDKDPQIISTTDLTVEGVRAYFEVWK